MHLARLPLAAALVGAGLGACHKSNEPAPADRPATRAQGRPPLTSPALDVTFFRDLPALVIAINGDANGRAEILDQARARLRAGCPGPTSVCDALDQLGVALLGAYIADDATVDVVTVMVTDAKRRLNRALAGAKAAYIVDTAVLDQDDQRVVLAMSFSIDDVHIYATKDRPYPVVIARRGDRLNWSYELLGYSDSDDGEAMVLADSIDADLIELCSGPQRDQSPRHRALLSEVPEAGPWSELALAYRVQWQRLVGDAEVKALVRLDPVPPLVLSAEAAELAAQLWPAQAVAELRAANNALLGHPALPRLRRHHAIRTAVHEVQHRLDVDRPLPMATVVASSSRADRDAVNAELSAYLAELAHSTGSARSSLARLIEFANSEGPGKTEAEVARLILEGLGPGLAKTPGLGPHSWDVAAMDPVAISRQARRLWKKLFGRALAEIAKED